ncbi:MAG: hypothetical protein JKY87_00140 [Mariprofundus sp.]|nr:hypothetical protein [Mariprofundus sp.]
MKPTHAGISGSFIGLLLGSAVCLIQNIHIEEALFRIFILTSAGAWMGVMLAWLNQLLPSKSDHHHSEHTDVG